MNGPGRSIAAIRRPEDLFPAAWFSVATLDGEGDEAALHPLERPLVARAVPKRRRDFAAGRSCARRALARFACEAQPILRDDDGCPLWPAGLLGSISHTAGCAVGVVAARGAVAAVGVDVETIDAAAGRSLLAHVCGPAERAWIEALPAGEHAAAACAVFSIKESIYKCVYAATGGERLGFGDATVSVDLRRGLFTARLSRPLGPERRSRVAGRVGRGERHVFSGLSWLATPSRSTP